MKLSELIEQLIRDMIYVRKPNAKNQSAVSQAFNRINQIKKSLDMFEQDALAYRRETEEPY